MNHQEIRSRCDQGRVLESFHEGEVLTLGLTLSFPMGVGKVRLAKETWKELGPQLAEAGASCLFYPWQQRGEKLEGRVFREL